MVALEVVLLVLVVVELVATKQVWNVVCAGRSRDMEIPRGKPEKPQRSAETGKDVLDDGQLEDLAGMLGLEVSEVEQIAAIAARVESGKS